MKNRQQETWGYQFSFPTSTSKHGVINFHFRHQNRHHETGLRLHLATLALKTIQSLLMRRTLPYVTLRLALTLFRPTVACIDSP